MMLAEISPNLIGFTTIAILAIFSALGVILNRDPIRAALSLVATFLLIALLYFSLQANVLGISQIAVYAGAIMVLFLFILTSLQVKKSKIESRDIKIWLAFLFGLSLVAAIGVQLYQVMNDTPWQPNAPANYGGPESIGKVLFTTYAYPFEAISVLLLIGLVGSILLAKRRIR